MINIIWDTKSSRGLKLIMAAVNIKLERPTYTVNFQLLTANQMSDCMVHNSQSSQFLFFIFFLKCTFDRSFLRKTNYEFRN